MTSNDRIEAALAALDRATPGLTMSGSCDIFKLWTQLKYAKFADNLNRTVAIHHAESVRQENKNNGEPTTQNRQKNKKESGAKGETNAIPNMSQSEKELREQGIQNTIALNLHKDLNGCVLEMSRQNNSETFIINLEGSASIAGFLLGQDLHQVTLGDLTMLFLALVVDFTQYQIWSSAAGTVMLSNQENDIALIAAAPDLAAEVIRLRKIIATLSRCANKLEMDGVARMSAEERGKWLDKQVEEIETRDENIAEGYGLERKWFAESEEDKND